MHLLQNAEGKMLFPAVEAYDVCKAMKYGQQSVCSRLLSLVVQKSGQTTSQNK